MSLTLGEKLQQAREARGTTISEVAEQTRISRLYLEAIENNDYRTLPGGIFNKGFVKSYAKYVGVDEQEALQDYSQLISEQDGDVSEEPKTYRPEVLTDERTNSSSLMTIIFAVVILGLMTWGILTLVKYLQNEQQNQPVANTNTANTSANVNANTTANVSQPIPSTDKISIEFKTLVEPISVSYWTDGGKMESKLVSTEPLILNPNTSVKISYYGGYTSEKVQLTINGKQITAPNPPAKGKNVLFEINKTNIAQILQSGQVSTGETTNANTNTAR